MELIVLLQPSGELENQNLSFWKLVSREFFSLQMPLILSINIPNYCFLALSNPYSPHVLPDPEISPSDISTLKTAKNHYKKIFFTFSTHYITLKTSKFFYRQTLSRVA
jgi:hypothetical protein